MRATDAIRTGYARATSALVASALIARRRARHDAPQLAMTAGLVAVTTFLAIVAPGIMLVTLDDGARDAARRAGSAIDVVAHVTVAQPVPGLASATPEGAIGIADNIRDYLPPALRQLNDGTALSVMSGDVRVRLVDDEPWNGDGDLVTQLAMLTPENTESIVLAEGRLPGPRPFDSRAPIEIAISTAAAEASGLSIGSVFDLGTPPPAPDPDDIADPFAEEELPPITEFEVVGIAEQPATRFASLWEDTPEAWEPRVREQTPNAPRSVRFSGLVSPTGISAAEAFLDSALIGSIRLSLDPERLTYDLAIRGADESRALVSDGQVLGGDSLAEVSAQADLHKVLASYPGQARAALAQMSLMMAGVLGIAAVVIILLARLLLGQRAAAIALERARGASVASIGVRGVMESSIVTAVGTIVGVSSALLVIPGGLRDPLPVIAVATVSLLAGPVLAMALARSMWTGRRDPANRRDRQLLARKRRMQRLVVEAAVIALAAASIVSIRGRGLLQTRTGGVDPLLVAAPLLLAIAVTILVIRIYPYPVRVIGAAAQRTRGVLGLLGSVRARSAVAALPLLALALGAALSVTGAMLVDTVRNGQSEAAWQRVGADARIDGEIDPSIAEQLRQSPGVDLVSATRSRGGVALDLGTSTSTVTVIGIDEDYADVVDALPGQPSAESLRELFTADTGDRLAMVVDPATAERLLREEIAMYFGPAYIELEVIGSSEVAPSGYLDGPFAFVDRDALVALLPEPQLANRYLVMGDGAAAAIDEADTRDSVVITWDGWIAERRGLALVSGVESTMVFAVIAVALLSIVALVATVIGGARARGRALSMLRTLGMPPRLGWWLALAELGPLIAAAILGGIVSGIVVTLSLAGSIGLDVLAGGITVPAISMNPLVFVGLAGAGVLLLILGSLADVIVHRRDKLSEVLRVGETV